MIGNVLKYMLTRGLLMKRWNNFPRIEDVSLLDNIGFTLHVALFLAYLEEKEGKYIDREFLIKRIIFHSFKSLVLSDISSGTKSYIRKNDQHIFTQIENKAIEYLFSLDAPEYFKNDMRSILYDTDHHLEMEIIHAAKKYAGYQECLVNHKVFPDIYEVPLAEVVGAFEVQKKSLKSLEILLETSSFQKYLSHIRRLSHCMRWNQQKRIFPISVMSHLVLTTFLTYVIVSIENKNGANYPMKDMLLRAVYHDIPEAITGDIITPTKKAVEGFRELLEKVEIDMMDDYLFCFAPKEYKLEVQTYMLSPFDGENGKLVKYADIMSSLLESKIEVNYGSIHYVEMYRFIKKKVNAIDAKSIDYLLKQVLDSFDENGNEDIHLEAF